jgi:hypothetical protein
VVLIRDFDNRQRSPDWQDDAEVVAARADAMQIRVLHGQVGLTDIAVYTGDWDGQESLVYQGEFNLRLGRLWITDANEENSLVLGVEPGRHEIMVRADQCPWPRRLIILIDNP